MSTRLAIRARVLVAVGVAVMMALAPPDALAQRVAFSLPTAFVPSPVSSPTTFVYDLAALRTVWSTPGQMARGVFTADGRNLLYQRATASGVELILADTVNGASVVLPIDFEPRMSHPHDLAVYGLTRQRATASGMAVGVLARLDPAGLHEFGGCPADSTAALALSPDAATLVSVCESGDVAVVDAATGSTRRVITAGARPPAGVAVANGHAVVVQPGSGTSDAVAMFDLATGAPAGAVTFPPGGPIDTNSCVARVSAIVPDGRSVVMTCGLTVLTGRPHNLSTTRMFDPASTTWGAPIGDGEPFSASVDPDGRALLAVWQYSIGGEFMLLDLRTSATSLRTPLLSTLATAYGPATPTLVVAQTGRRVDLSWTLPVHSPAATRYLLEIGTAPGLSNLGLVDLGGALSFPAPGVPPGTYYVRLRGVNYGGTGAASNELRIDVQ